MLFGDELKTSLEHLSSMYSKRVFSTELNSLSVNSCGNAFPLFSCQFKFIITVSGRKIKRSENAKNYFQA